MSMDFGVIIKLISDQRNFYMNYSEFNINKKIPCLNFYVFAF